MTTEIRDFDLIQGATNVVEFVAYSEDDTVLPVDSVTLGFPTIIESTAHGLPTAPIPVGIVNVPGLSTDGFAKAARVYVEKIDADTMRLMVDSTAFDTYTAGGHLVVSLPRDLTGYTARASFRRSLGAVDTLLDLTNVAGITLGTTDGGVVMTITDTQSEAWTAPVAVYDLELESGGGVVERFAAGTATLSREATR